MQIKFHVLIKLRNRIVDNKIKSLLIGILMPPVIGTTMFVERDVMQNRDIEITGIIQLFFYLRTCLVGFKV